MIGQPSPCMRRRPGTQAQRLASVLGPQRPSLPFERTLSNVHLSPSDERSPTLRKDVGRRNTDRRGWVYGRAFLASALRAKKLLDPFASLGRKRLRIVPVSIGAVGVCDA